MHYISFIYILEMAAFADHQLFERSCKDTPKFPQNLVYPDTYDHLLVSYLERLQKEEVRLFHDESKAEASIRDFDDSSRGVFFQATP
jgi:hypothetical protein